MSVPALGALGVRRRAQQVALRLVHVLLGEPDGDVDVRRLQERARGLGSDVHDSADGLEFAARVLTGHLRLLVGMGVENRAWRHGGVALASVLGITATLIVGAELWERAPDRRVRQQVLLFNAATTATVLIGVAVLYATLFVLALVAGLLLVVPDLLSAELGHRAGFADYAELAWLTSSLATVGGALGAGLETDEAVRQAAYSHRGEVDAAAD